MSSFEREIGPWRCFIEADKVVVESDDFTHDVRLYVDGDFAGVQDKLAYGYAIAAALNTVMPLRPVLQGHEVAGSPKPPEAGK